MTIDLYYSRFPNAGDMMNENVVQDLLGYEINRKRFYDCQVTGIGSLLDVLLEGGALFEWQIDKLHLAEKDITVHVWGTGFIREQPNAKATIRPMKVHVLRGKRSKEIMEKVSSSKIDCPLADPGLLAPLLFKELPAKKYNLGIIPHYIEFEEEKFAELAAMNPNSIMIDMREPVPEVLEKIASCECIVSSSLHGLVFADSFGIPNQWVTLTDQVIGDGFKFHDYYSSFGLPAHKIDLNHVFPQCETIHQNYAITPEMVIEKQDSLIKSFHQMMKEIEQEKSL